MAKQNKNNATDKENITEVAGTVSPGNEKTQTDSPQMQTPPVLTETDKSGSLASGDNSQGSGDGTGTSSDENSEMDTQAEDKGTGWQGGDTENQLTDNSDQSTNEDNGGLSEIYDEESAKDALKEFIKEVIAENGGKQETNINEPKADTEKRLRIAADIFKKNDRCEVLHFTSDFTPFFKENDAIKHTRTGKLSDKTIISIPKQ